MSKIITIIYLLGAALLVTALIADLRADSPWTQTLDDEEQMRFFSQLFDPLPEDDLV